jgi:hypothetical protein
MPALITLHKQRKPTFFQTIHHMSNPKLGIPHPLTTLIKLPSLTPVTLDTFAYPCVHTSTIKIRACLCSSVNRN